MYSKFAMARSRYSVRFRKRFSLHLAPWHTMKQALYSLFHHNASFIMLRLWGAIYPLDKTCLVKPRTLPLIKFFNICITAYDKVFELLQDSNAFPRHTYTYLRRLRNIFEVFLPAIRDFIYYVRMGNAEKAFEKRKVLMLLFMSMNSKTADSKMYVYGELLYMIHREYWKDNCPDSLEMEKLNYQLFNEEIGEISLSILARDDFTYGSKFNEDRQNTSYTLIPFLRKLTKIYSGDKHEDCLSRYKNISPDEPTVLAAVEVFNCVLSELKHGTACEVVAPVVKGAYRFSSAEMEEIDPREIDHFPIDQPSELVSLYLVKLRKNFGKLKQNATSFLHNMFAEGKRHIYM